MTPLDYPHLEAVARAADEMLHAAPYMCGAIGPCLSCEAEANRVQRKREAAHREFSNTFQPSTALALLSRIAELTARVESAEGEVEGLRGAFQ